MKDKKFILGWLRNNIGRTILLLMLLSIISFFTFFSLYFNKGISSTLDTMKNKMGADFMVIPKGAKKDNEGILLAGTPSNFYMDNSVEQRLKNVENIEKISSQIYVATLSASCCSFPVQAIGVDLNSDFTIKPWVLDEVNSLNDNEIIAGNNIGSVVGEEVKFFDETYIIKSRLKPTGMGFDNTIFMNKKSALDMMKKAPNMDPSRSFEDNKTISNVMIKFKDGVDLQKAGTDILREFKGKDIDIIESTSFINSFKTQLKTLIKYIALLMGLLTLLCISIVSILFKIDFDDRKKEFAALRIMGASNKRIQKMLINYTLIISLVSSFIGSLLSLIVVLLFNRTIKNNIDLPFNTLNIKDTLVLLIITILFIVTITLLSQYRNFRTIKEKEMALILRGNN